MYNINIYIYIYMLNTPAQKFIYGIDILYMCVST